MKEDIKETRFENGLVVLTDRMPGVRSATLGFFYRVGSRNEPAANAPAHRAVNLVASYARPARGSIGGMDAVTAAFGRNQNSLLAAGCPQGRPAVARPGSRAVPR